MQIRDRDALIIVDVQNDFCPDGTLPVPDGDEVVPVINGISDRFPIVVATQDWHPPGHISFASSHPGKNPFDTIQLGDTTQVLWPDHCIQGTNGAEFHPGLDLRPVRFIIRKGTNPRIDSYSAFLENDKKTCTGLEGLLKHLDIERLYICGLATDFCVRATAIDAIQAGFSVVVLEDASRGVDIPTGSLDKAINEMKELGIRVISTRELK